VISFAPRSYALDLCDLTPYREEDTGCLALSGQILKGIPLDVYVEIPGLDPIPERIYFGDTKFGVLGQSKFLEMLGAFFLNEPLGVDVGRFKLIPRNLIRPDKSGRST
jgi:hypothetical protein